MGFIPVSKGQLTTDIRSREDASKIVYTQGQYQA